MEVAQGMRRIRRSQREKRRNDGMVCPREIFFLYIRGVAPSFLSIPLQVSTLNSRSPTA